MCLGALTVVRSGGHPAHRRQGGTVASEEQATQAVLDAITAIASRMVRGSSVASFETAEAQALSALSETYAWLRSPAQPH